MSWYFLGGFSAYFSVPSGRRLNHSGCSSSHGWSGEHWIAKSSAISRPSFFASATRRSNSLMVPSPGSIASWPPSLEPIAHGLPGSPLFAVSALLRPLRFVLPMGWTGGKYTTSKPSSLSFGSTVRTPANPPHERGKSSYHAPKRASSRSTSTVYEAETVFSERSPAAAASASSSITLSRSSSTAPSASSPARSSCPPATFRRSSSWNEATRSTHASTRYVHSPGTSTENEPAHSSFPSGWSGASAHFLAPRGL